MKVSFILSRVVYKRMNPYQRCIIAMKDLHSIAPSLPTHSVTPSLLTPTLNTYHSLTTKDLDPRLRDSDDANLDDIPSVQAQRQKLIDQGLDPDEFKNKFMPHFLIDSLRNEYKNFDAMSNIKAVAAQTQSAVHILSAGLVPDADANLKSAIEKVEHPDWVKSAQDLEDELDIESARGDVPRFHQKQSAKNPMHSSMYHHDEGIHDTKSSVVNSIEMVQHKSSISDNELDED